jgi:uncharacterized protein (DUF1778 family)
MKTENLHIRCTDDEKSTLERAARVRKTHTGGKESITETVIEATLDYAAHADNKILVDSNIDKADLFLASLENDYLPVVKYVIAEINGLGIKKISRDLLSEVMKGDYLSLQVKFSNISQADLNGFNSPAGKFMMREALGDSFSNSCRKITSICSSNNIDSRPFTDPSLFEYLSLDDQGNPYISEVTKEQIRESFCEYILSRSAARVYKAHEKACTALQELLTSLQKSGMDKGLCMLPWPFIINLFELSEVEGKFKIRTKKLNYNLSDKEESDE